MANSQKKMRQIAVEREEERERETLLQEEYKHISSQQTVFHRPRSSTLHHTGLQAKQQ